MGKQEYRPHGHGTGALLPPESEWQLGKTAASVAFVVDAERFLERCRSAKKVALLREAIRRIKQGTLVISKWVSVREYLEDAGL